MVVAAGLERLTRANHYEPGALGNLLLREELCKSSVYLKVAPVWA